MNVFFLKAQEIINPYYLHYQSGGRIELQDKDNKGKKLGNPVFIEVKREIICLELDKKNESIFKFFNTNVTNLCKIADRILFYPKNDELYVFVIELKTQSTKDAFKQIQASYVLSEYVVNTVRRMLNFKDLTVNYRGLIFSGKSYKQKTSPKDNFTDVKNTQFKYQCLQSGQLIHLDGFIG